MAQWVVCFDHYYSSLHGLLQGYVSVAVSTSRREFVSANILPPLPYIEEFKKSESKSVNLDPGLLSYGSAYSGGWFSTFRRDMEPLSSVYN
jgi:hypothetical protein